MITTNPEDKRFLALAVKKLSGEASADESSRLAELLLNNESYQTTFSNMQALQQNERDDEFLQSAIRVLCGTATPKESEAIRNLEQSNPELWSKFQFMREVITGVARAARVGNDVQPTPMPERVRSALTAKLTDFRSRKSD